MDANMKHKKTLDQQFLKNYIAVLWHLINIFLGIFKKKKCLFQDFKIKMLACFQLLCIYTLLPILIFLSYALE